MKINRRHALQSIALLPLAVTATATAGGAVQPNTAEPPNPCVGSWFTTKGITSIVLSIEPHGEGLLLIIENGAFNISRIKWKPAPGGVVLPGIMRLRMWAGRHDQEIRAEREDLPKEASTETFKKFPLAFFMSRVSPRNIPQGAEDRPLPAGWDAATLPTDWDSRAGQWNQ
jgi:hypothetical protein